MNWYKRILYQMHNRLAGYRCCFCNRYDGKQQQLALTNDTRVPRYALRSFHPICLETVLRAEKEKGKFKEHAALAKTLGGLLSERRRTKATLDAHEKRLQQEQEEILKTRRQVEKHTTKYRRGLSWS